MTECGISKRYVLIFVLAGLASAFSQQPAATAPVSNQADQSASATQSSQTAKQDDSNQSQATSNVASEQDKNTGDQDKKTDSKTSSDNSANPPQSAAEPSIPTTTAMPETKEVKSIDSLLQPAPLPNGKVSLIGGTIHSVDQVRNRIVVDIFGKGKMKVSFDERSHIYRNGVETTQLALHKGDRVYLDTQLSQGKIFARNVQVQTSSDAASVSGQIVSFNSNSGLLVLRDPLSSQPVSLKLTPASVISQQGQPGSRADLLPDSLVTVRFAPQPGRPVKELEVLARRGAQFTFYGTLTHLDLRSGLLAVENKSDSKLYDIRFAPARIGVTEELTTGAEVAIVATFDGHYYTAQTVKVTRVAKNEKADKAEDPR